MLLLSFHFDTQTLITHRAEQRPVKSKPDVWCQVELIKFTQTFCQPSPKFSRVKSAKFGSISDPSRN